MVTKILNLRSIQFTLGALIILGAILCIFTPNYFLFKMGARFAGLIMLGYLVLGLFFLILKQPKLMFISLACCAGLTIYLKSTSNSDLKHAAPTTEVSVRVAHINVSGFDNDYESTMAAIKDTKADLISIQELTPEWHYVLKETLSEDYPYSTSLVRFDPFGMAIFSKYPISNLDTFYFEDIPNLSGTIEVKNPQHRFKFVCAHTSPPLYSVAYQKMQEHLQLVAQQATDEDNPVLAIGNFNAPPWWAEIQDLRAEASLSDSRRSATYGLSEIFQSPGDYIFYNNRFSCLGFENIFNGQSTHLGILGTYQFKNNVKKPVK